MNASKLRWLLAITLLLSISSSYAQSKKNKSSSDPFKPVYDYLDSVDTRTLRTGYFLNRGFLLSHQVEEQRQVQAGNPESNVVLSSVHHFQSYSMGLEKAAVERTSAPSEAAVEKVLATNQDQPNTVPVGVLAVQGEWLQDYEIKESIAAKKRRRRIHKAYERVTIYAASVLKTKVYSGEVTFTIPTALFHLSNRHIREVSIDVADGRGFRRVKPGGRYKAQYTSAGEKGIAVKFRTQQGEVLSYSVLDVVTLEVEEPDMEFNLNGPVNGRSLPGGEAQVFLGCDGVFDQPVIIVEGYDHDNSSSIIDIRDDYEDDALVEGFLTANGRDVVYLNFAEGGADIRSNARVLERLIDDINYQKVGNQPLVVIGESMGGLVARYCLTDMERRGRTHQVGHYVSFDSPQLGANTPVGFQRLLLDISDNATPLNIAAALLTNELRRLRSPASRQMLLRFEGPNPHPDFTALQNEFNTLGFPRQGGIRNISIVNADENGGRQNPGVNFNPGDQIFEIAFTLYGVLTLRARTWTNQVNGASKVSAFSIFSGPIPSIRRESTYNFDAFNYDIAPGGWEDDQGTGDRNGWGLNIVNPIEWFSRTFNNFGRGEFAFIPLFSGVAYTGPLNNQNDIERSLADIENNNWTPFDVVYGDDENSPHIRAAFVQNRWNEFFRDELGLTINLACQPGAGIAAVPPPRFSVPKTYCPLELATFRISDASYVDNLYDYRWEVTGNSYRRTGTGETFSVRHDTPGVYTLRVTRSLRNGNGTPRVTTRTMTIVPRSNSKCDDAPPGDIDVRSAVSVEKPEGSDSTLVLVPTVRLWPNPTHGQLHIVYRMNEPGPVSITLTSAIDGRSQAAILPAIHRPMGNYEETYYTDQVNPGLYIVTVRTGRKVVQEKVFIK